MKTDHPTWPAELLAEFIRDSDAAGYTGRRKDSPKSRWFYMRKLLALGRQQFEIIKAD